MHQRRRAQSFCWLLQTLLALISFTWSRITSTVSAGDLRVTSIVRRLGCCGFSTESSADFFLASSALISFSISTRAGWTTLRHNSSTSPIRRTGTEKLCRAVASSARSANDLWSSELFVRHSTVKTKLILGGDSLL